MKPIVISYAQAAWKKLIEIAERPPNHMMRSLLLLTIVIVILSLTSAQVGTAPATAQAPSAPQTVASSQTSARSSHRRICGSMRPNGVTPASACMAPPEHQEPPRVE